MAKAGTADCAKRSQSAGGRERAASELASFLHRLFQPECAITLLPESTCRPPFRCRIGFVSHKQPSAEREVQRVKLEATSMTLPLLTLDPANLKLAFPKHRRFLIPVCCIEINIPSGNMRTLRRRRKTIGRRGFVLLTTGNWELKTENCRLSIDHRPLAPNRSPIHEPDLFIAQAGGLRYNGNDKERRSYVR
jgi:hypothetical protein